MNVFKEVKKMIRCWEEGGGCILHILPHFILEFADRRCPRADHDGAFARERAQDLLRGPTEEAECALGLFGELFK